jgi:hypothetical protein
MRKKHFFWFLWLALLILLLGVFYGIYQPTKIREEPSFKAIPSLTQPIQQVNPAVEQKQQQELKVLPKEQVTKSTTVKFTWSFECEKK